MNPWASVYIPALDSRFAIPALTIYNTETGSLVQVPKKNGYSLYVCGITPYDATHLGHAATYLAFDLLNRYLRATGAKVSYVQNITDIDDPLLERAKRDGIDWRELAQSQIELFKGDMVDLHVLPPDHYIGVVEAMPMVVKAIESLKLAQTTYLVDQDLYFDVHSDDEYGNRSHLSESEALAIFAERGGDPGRKGKRDPFDALVWLSAREGEPFWPSPFGDGRPGWHIECCAIALNYLPESSDEYSIDFQGGGSDLIFPHHEMSAAQSRAINGKKFSQFYMHAGMIGLDGEKMSKSKGNLVFVSQLIASGIEPAAIRWALMGHRYSSDLMWSNEILTKAIADIDSLRIALSRVEVAPTDEVIHAIIMCLSQNLDTTSVKSVLMKWVSDTGTGATGGNPGELSRAIDSLLGLAL
jgi:L-cysteine:1D-myo-inositol 2-amino-2-deoxy-alpha-D-glucopyranoside ligase